MSVIKKICSYLFPIVEERRTSGINPVLEITWSNGTKVLNSDKANYSYGSLHEVMAGAFKKFPFTLKNNHEVLILGFGAGSVWSILRNNYHFKGAITGIELDQEVVNIATEYFDVSKDNNLNLVVADAMDFTNKCRSCYKLIVVDLFLDLIVPKKFISSNFIIKLISILKENGRIIFNIMPIDSKENERINELKKICRIQGCTSREYSETFNNHKNRVLIIDK